VQRDERDLGGRVVQAIEQIGADVDGDHVVPQSLQRVLDARARAQRDPSLERATAFQHGDPRHSSRERCRGRCPTLWQ